ncbi:MAG: malto-oligosyltrehalose trehalohydrolase [Nitrospiraceae bacterium]|nr:MAG: malto-oligosyltrehalose trehalohydrolase [Nitrospiraceae bacterium]
MRIGAWYHGNGKCEFVVWAPFIKELKVKIMSPDERLVSPESDGCGYWRSEVDGVFPGARYLYRLDGGTERPDPASHFQPDGVHGPSQVVDHISFQWEDGDWKGIPLHDYMIYELHVGTFTGEGTFVSAVTHLDYLKELGITAVELMPVAQFPGERNWGYDGACPFAVQNSYGGPDGLKRLVNECHKKGIAVILDVVYNHLGPEGNYTNNFGFYFTDRYKTPWGDAVNFDGPYSNEVRKYFISNALYWTTEYHVDALRIDAIHGIYDFSARHFLQELADAVHKQSEALKRKVYVIAESDLNDVRAINPAETGGHGLDAQWNDDFHHALHTLLTGEGKGYYQDFGSIKHLEKAFREGFVYSGEYSKYRKRRHGSSTKDRPASQFVVFSQNHDQVGNRMTGDRLSQTRSFEKLKLAAGVVILSPFIPLIFMGEEYGETAPFQYFVSHSDEHLIEAVRKGRREEFASFGWEGEVPDPQAEQTFLNSKINIGLHHEGKHNVLFRFYRELIRMRKEIPALSNSSKDNMEVMRIGENTPLPHSPLERGAGVCNRGESGEKVLFVRRWFEGDEIFCVYNFSESRVNIKLKVEGVREKILDSSSKEWGGEGGVSVREIEPNSPEVSLNIKGHSLVLYRSGFPSPLTGRKRLVPREG